MEIYCLQMGRPDFDKPNEKSKGESKEYWEDILWNSEVFLKTEGLTDEEIEDTKREIQIAKENLANL